MVLKKLAEKVLGCTLQIKKQLMNMPFMRQDLEGTCVELEVGGIGQKKVKETHYVLLIWNCHLSGEVPQNDPAKGPPGTSWPPRMEKRKIVLKRAKLIFVANSEVTFSCNM